MLRAIAVSLLGLIPLGAQAEPVLMMAEAPGCYWCARWHEEIGPIYPKTAEGHAAPLQRYDLQTGTPHVDFAQSVQFTPTFILVEDGVELGRVEGYPGEDFFWGLLGMMFERAEISLDETG